MTTEGIVCRYDSRHVNHVLHSILCMICQRPLFKVRWWYHVVLLNFIILSAGFVIGEYGKEWLAFLIFELMFIGYWVLIFRKFPQTLLFGVILLLLALLIVFVETEGDLGFSELRWAKIIALYVVAVLLVLGYVASWVDVASEHKVGILKSLSALSLGLFLTALVVAQLDKFFAFLDPPVSQIINHHLYFRTLLLAATAVHLLVYAAVKHIQNEIDVPEQAIKIPKGFLRPLVPPKDDNLLADLIRILNPLTNILLSFFKGIAEILVSVSNFLIRITLIVVLRLIDYSVELLTVALEMLKVLTRALWQFLRFVALPLLIFYELHSLLQQLTTAIARHITGASQEWQLLEFTWLILKLNLSLVLLVWLINESHSPRHPKEHCAHKRIACFTAGTLCIYCFFGVMACSPMAARNAV